MGEHLATIAVLLVSVPAIALTVGWAVARRHHDRRDITSSLWLYASVKIGFAVTIAAAALVWVLFA
jgi:hypothetical protein